MYIFFVTEIQLCKVNTRFLCHFAPMFMTNHVQFNVGEHHWLQIKWENLHQPCTMVCKVKINEQNNDYSDMTLVLHSKCEAIRTLLRKDRAVLNFISDMLTCALCIYKTPGFISHRELVWYEVVKIKKLVALMVQKF